MRKIKIIKKILNLFAGFGGNRSSWKNVQVDAVEIEPEIAKIYKKRFPEDQVFVQDVDSFLRDKNNNLEDYDLIWASPPCTTHSQMQKFPRSETTRIAIPRMDQIYGLMIWFPRNYSGKWVIENVQPYYIAPIPRTVFIDRHYFWANFPIKKTTFRNGTNWKHGKIGGIMRKPISLLIKELDLTPVLADIKATFGRHTKKRYEQVIRNCVDPKVGKYILD